MEDFPSITTDDLLQLGDDLSEAKLIPQTAVKILKILDSKNISAE
jgi:hypothetical protein